MIKLLKKYFIYSIVGVFLLMTPCNYVQADVCFTEEQAVDLITLLDASERDLELLDSCQQLVQELYKEIEERDDKIVSLTNEIINANQQVIKYKRKYKVAKQIAWYTSIAGAVIILIEVLPLL